MTASGEEIPRRLLYSTRTPATTTRSARLRPSPRSISSLAPTSCTSSVPFISPSPPCCRYTCDCGVAAVAEAAVGMKHAAAATAERATPSAMGGGGRRRLLRRSDEAVRGSRRRGVGRERKVRARWPSGERGRRRRTEQTIRPPQSPPTPSVT